eukprot:12148618-Alexandrium_andersonii.AAC.1
MAGAGTKMADAHELRELRKEIWRQAEQVVIADLASGAPELTDPPQDARTVFCDSRAAEGRPQPDENARVR